jgi:hypothetical protein
LDRATLNILKEFREAITWGKGGEVVLRSGEHTGRVFFVGGRIAWVVASTIKKTFFGYLVENTELTRDDLREVYDACKKSGDNFGETIVEWGLLDEATLRVHLLSHVSENLVEILSWPALHSMFVPDQRPYKGALTFDLEEVLEAALRADTQGRLPFAGSSVAELLDAIDAVGFDEVAQGAEQTPDAGAPAAGAAEPATPTMLAAPPRRQFPVLGVALGATALLLVAGLGVYWYLFLRPAPGKAVQVADMRVARDAGRPDLPRPDAPTRLDAGQADGRPTADTQPAPTGIVVGGPREGVGAVRVVSKPSRALIYFDGVYTGRRTPTTLGGVAAGNEHVIQVERPRYQPMVKRFKLAPGMQAQLYLTLKRARGRPPQGEVEVRLVSEPTEALVFVNRKQQPETTPATVKLDPRRISYLELRKQGFRRWRRKVKPPRGVPLTYEVKLRPQRPRRPRRRRGRRGRRR